jgi:hypothetical protein
MNAMFHIRVFRVEDTDEVIALWQRCDLVRSQNDPRKDIARKLQVRPDLFLVGELGGAIVATWSVMKATVAGSTIWPLTRNSVVRAGVVA